MKKFRNFLLNGQTITLPQAIVDKFSLPSNTINIERVKALYEAEKDCDLKMAPKLSKNVLEPGRFDKIKVGLAPKLFDTPLKQASNTWFKRKVQGAKCNLATAWFIGLVRKWFDLMTFRNASLALSHFNEETYQSAIEFLQNVVDIFKT